MSNEHTTDIFGYRDTGYIDTPLTVTVLVNSVNSMLPKSVNVSKYLVTVTLFSYTEGVTVTENLGERLDPRVH